MKTYILVLSVLTLTFPAYAQLGKQAPKALLNSAKITEQVTRQIAYSVPNNARCFHIGLSNSPAKQILSLRTQFQQEYESSLRLYYTIQQSQKTHDISLLRETIEKTVVNNTLRKSLLSHLEANEFSSMEQEVEAYFHLTPRLPVFAYSSSPTESFAQQAAGYLSRHTHKPSWKLREIIKFGHIRTIKPKLDKALAQNGEIAFDGLTKEETQQLNELYSRAETANEQLRNFLFREKLSQSDREDLTVLLRQAYTGYENLLAFARNSQSVQNTLKIYTNLLADFEAFTAKHHRFPSWDIPEERMMLHLFNPLVFANQVNFFEEIQPVIIRLYRLTEQFPVTNSTERQTLDDLKKFVEKHGHQPRSVAHRTFTNTKPNEVLLYRDMLYWKEHSPAFAENLRELTFPAQTDTPPSF